MSVFSNKQQKIFYYSNSDPMYETGETCQIAGLYRYSGHGDGSQGCHPAWNEKDIKLKVGIKFPSVGSCKKAAQWVFLRPV